MNTSNQVQIYNMALAAIGVSQLIQDVKEGSLQANVCNIFWEASRDQALQDFPWDFAMRFADLQLINKQVRGWFYAYGCPSDCIQPRLLVPYGYLSGTVVIDNDLIPPGYQQILPDFWSLYLGQRGQRIPYEMVENEAAGGLAILTNEPNAVLAYTGRVETITLWSPAFVNALVWLLATKICSPLSSNPKFAESAGKAYEAAKLQAGALSMNSGTPKPEPESEFIRARY